MENRRRYVTPMVHPGRQALVAIENYRNCVKDQVDFLRQENHEMKIRISKFDQIEARVETLLIRDQQNTRELELLRSSLHQKAAEVQDLRHCVELEKHTAAQTQAALKVQLQNMVTEIGWVNRQKNQTEVISERRLEEFRIMATRDLEALKVETTHARQQAHLHISQLQDQIRALNAELQHKQRDHGSTRLRMMDQLQQMATRLDHATRDNQNFANENCNLRTDLTALIAQLQNLKQAHQALTVQNLKNQQQRAQILLDLKELQRQFGGALMNQRMLQDRLAQSDGQISRLANMNKQMSLKYQQLEAELRKKNRLLDEYHNQLGKEQDRHRQIQAETTTRIFQLEENLQQSKMEQMSLIEKLQIVQHENEGKTVEIRDLLYGIQKLQEKLLAFQAKCRILQNDNIATAEQIAVLGHQRQTECFEIRSIQEKLMLKQTHIQQLEDLLEVERNARLLREKQIQQMRRTLTNPQTVARKYQDQMLKMLHKFEAQKATIEQRFNAQKTHMRELFEFELRDTKDLFQRKLRVLEEQLHVSDR